MGETLPADTIRQIVDETSERCWKIAREQIEAAHIQSRQGVAEVMREQACLFRGMDGEKAVRQLADVLSARAK